ncbi:MAG: hypothetical protein ACK5KR_00790 [Breznakia sp.]
MKKIKNICNGIVMGVGLYLTKTVIEAEGATTPTFDNSAAETAANKFVEPLTTFLLWATPVIAGVVIMVIGILWMIKDEDEREQKPFMKQVKKIIIVAIVVESISTILKIVGIG